MYVVEKSSSGMVPAKCLNKSVRPQAEGTEGRPLVEENTLQQPRTGIRARINGCPGCGVSGRGAIGPLPAMDPRWEADVLCGLRTYVAPRPRHQW
jgi:hypothetical protein